MRVASFILTRFSGEVGKLLGEKWKELTEKEKVPYEQKAKADKARYEKEKLEYAGVSLNPTLPRYRC